jgi:hypothetical protein
MNLTFNDNVLYILIILILLTAILIKYLCVYTFKCDKQYNKKNIYNF